MHTAEVDCFNQLVSLSPLPLTYHLPGLFGLRSLENEQGEVAGIVILGSAASVNENLSWQNQLSQWLFPRLAAKVPTLGICYGHQLIAHLFGGKVERSWPAEKKQVGFREVSLRANRLWGPEQKGNLFVSHCEVVSESPRDFQIVGTSPLVKVEALAHSTLPIWTFQAHPESTQLFTARRQPNAEPVERLAFGRRLVQAFLQFIAR